MIGSDDFVSAAYCAYKILFCIYLFACRTWVTLRLGKMRQA
jgi:hypothetical protein